MKNREFVGFFNLHWAKVYGLALSMCGNQAAAKDICQDIFLSIWTRGLIFDNELEASKYLARSTKYQILNHFRNKKNQEDVTDINYNDFIEISRYNPESILLDKELSLQFEMVIARLEEPSKSIFMLSREQNLTYKQIADEMGIAVKTVEKHISRALKELKSSLHPA
ncbi:sigma-70 family RNA polymerase sigma factor [Pedobacter sp. HDW13]|uniref:sigma-70 family RNA polymerase sigma factor n=1 Tax=unclassified Pedobacter TaxID=2628915 RepID=UPI00131A050A|nr:MULTISPECIES: sigma-70 family RNA polymerase sigma factor [unclassified Pedobacter]QIL40465.1 sigma-70 family RNA polymerase sigma factor [Pedobacter sp. HDW13]